MSPRMRVGVGLLVLIILAAVMVLHHTRVMLAAPIQ